ncbi:MAG: DNA primase [Planctomycetota bacterium]
MPVSDDRDRVREATDLVRLVGEHVSLKPKGREFACLCPFHDDKNPSMYVSPAKQIFKCFVCGAGGTCFDFVMKYHKMDFVESLKYLADRAGIELSGKKRSASDGPSPRKRIAEANAKALAFFRSRLEHGEVGSEARAYLERRGVTAEMIEAFALGYGPDGWEVLANAVAKKGYPVGDFERAGLLKTRGDGSRYDALRHRLIFPIFDAIGRPIAFGGRKLREEDEPKYLNSPETELFNKSATLYGLHLAKKPIIDSGVAVIVEGYTDVIACHQHGASNVVAALGTALTDQHVRELRRYCQRVLLVMDGDAAGQKAADRAVELFLTGDVDMAIAILPGGQDPDELLRAGGIEAWETALSGAEDALDFLLRLMEEQFNDAAGVTAKQQTAERFLERLAGLGFAKAGTLRRGLVVQRLSGMLRLPEETVLEQLLSKVPKRRPERETPRESRVSEGDGWGGFADGPDDLSWMDAEAAERDADFDPGMGGADEMPSDAPVEAKRDGPVVTRSVVMAERQVIGVLLSYPQHFEASLEGGLTLDEALDPSRFPTPANRAAYDAVYGKLTDGQAVSLPGLLSELAESGDNRLCRVLIAADDELRKMDGSSEQALGMLRGAAKRLLEAADQRAQVQITENPLERLQRLRDSAPNRAIPARMPRVPRPHPSDRSAPQTPGLGAPP